MPTRLDNEPALVHAAQIGCAESFSILVNQYERQIYRLSLALTKNPQDAEDVLQEVLLKAYANIGCFRGESRFYTWLVRIATNEALTKLRRRQALSWVSLDEPMDSDQPRSAPRDLADWRDNPEESYRATELREVLSKALNRLDTKLRLVFVLRHMADLSSGDTARLLGLPVATVKTRLWRARLKLRNRLAFAASPASFWSGGRS